MANLKTVLSRKQSTRNFPKNEHFLSPDTHNVCVSWDKKYSFFGKLGAFCFLENLVLRFALMPYTDYLNPDKKCVKENLMLYK